MVLRNLAAIEPDELGIGQLFWYIRDAVVAANAETGQIVLWNPACEALFGYAPAEAFRLTIDALLAPRLRNRYRALLARRVAGNDALREPGATLELPALRKNGDEFFIEFTLSPIRQIASQRFVLAIIRDVSERKRAAAAQARSLGRERAARAEAEALAEIGRRISASLDLNEILQMVVDAAQRLVNADMAHIGLPDEHGALHAAAIIGNRTDAFRNKVLPPGTGLGGRVLTTGRPHQIEEYRATGTIKHDPATEQAAAGEAVVSVLAVPIRRLARTVGVFWVSSRTRRRFVPHEVALLERLAVQAAVAIENARANERLALLASHDELTGLYNRRSFDERLAQEIERTERYGRGLALIMLDIDHFKRINDRHGHPAGDLVLQWIAGLLQAKSRHSDWAARYGGDEIAVVLPETDAASAAQAAERIRAAVEAGPGEGWTLASTATVSLGIAVFPDSGKDVAALVQHADRALYTAKRRGRNRVCHSYQVAG